MMRAALPLPLLALVASSFLCRAAAQNLSSTQIQAVKDNLWLSAQQTWEIGTEAEALIESDAPAYSVFYAASLPPPAGQSTSAPYNYTALRPVLQIAYNAAANRSNSTGAQPIWYVEGGAAGDAASMGVAILVANWTGAPQPPLDVALNASTPRGVSLGRGVSYDRAAREQVEYLINDVPRAQDGAISHRLEQVQLWADSVYMVPPFLAYYGVLTGNETLVQEAYQQIKLYRSQLFDTNESLWRHILLGTGNVDPGFWSTGNAWAAAGMTRVLATIQHSVYASQMQSEMSNLTSWIVEIHDGMYKLQDKTSALFHNYANETESTDTGASFLEASSTALLASTVYRLALLQNVHTHVPNAERARKALSATAKDGSTSFPPFGSWGTGDGVGPATSFTETRSSSSSSPSATGTGWPNWPYTYLSSTSTTTAPSGVSSYSVSTPSAGVGSALSHFSPEMWLTPVVDPYNWAAQGGSSPEGQAFVVALYAAYQDWAAQGSPGVNSAMPRSVGARWGAAVAGTVALVMFVL